jgi:CRP-like cAMP-binding protein
LPDDAYLQTLTRGLFLLAFAQGRQTRPTWIARVAPELEEKVVEAGTVLYRKDDHPDWIYFIQDGEVELSRDGVAPIVMTGKTLLGALECSVELPRLRTATLMKTSSVVTAPGALWHDLFEDDPAMGRIAFVNTSQNLSSLFSRITNEHMILDHEFNNPLDIPRGSLDLVERMLALSGSQALQLAGMQALTTLAESAEERWFANAEDFADSSASSQVHFLLAGELVAHRREHTGTFTARAGSFVPMQVTHYPDLWSLEIRTPLRTLTFSSEVYLEELEEHLDFSRSVLTTLWRVRDWLLSNLLAPEGKIILT